MQIKSIAIAIVILLFVPTVLGQDNLSDAQIYSVAWSPDGTKIAGAGSNGFLRIWDANTGNTLIDFAGLSGKIYSVVWSPDSSKIASAGEDKIIRIWDAANGSLINSLQGHNETILSIDWSPDGSKLASVSFWETLSLRTWDVQNYTPIATLQAGELQHVKWSPDGTQLAVVNVSAGIIILDSSLNVPPLELSHYFEGTITNFTGGAGSVAWRFDGKAIAIGFQSGDIYIWDIINDSQIALLQNHTDWVGALAWSPDNTQIVSGSNDGSVKIWDVATGMMLASIPKGEGIILSVGWSPDGSKIAFGNSDNTTLQIVDAPMPLPSTATPAVPLRSIFNPPSCAVSCWLGIEPGITTQAQVQTILSNLNIEYTVNPASMPPIGTGEQDGIYNFVPPGMPFINSSKSVSIHFYNGIVVLIQIFVNIPSPVIIAEYGAPDHTSLIDNSVFRTVYSQLHMSFLTSISDLGRQTAVEIGTENSVSKLFLFTDNMVIKTVEDCAIIPGGCLFATATPSG
ncbi:MAG: WD40 repeat domain-containing protein [Anaerolineae bacterium]|nr:WD40 repeat domain-containing protein [Anaerolineae bacterium]